MKATPFAPEVVTLGAPPVRTGAPDWRPGRLPLAALLMMAPLVFGMWRAFPLYDDGWMVMLTRESGVAAISRSMPDRPLFGALLALVCGWGGVSPLVYVMVSAALWMIFALQSGWLWRRLFPEAAAYASLVSAAVLSPIVVQAQFCTVLIALPAVLPVILVQTGLLLLLRAPQSWAAAAGAACCFCAGTGISEYAVAAAAPALVLLISHARQADDSVTRRRLTGAVVLLALVTCVTYAVFLHSTHLESTRPSVSPAEVQQVARKGLASAALNFVNGFWYALVGAYSRALSNVTLYWDTKSSLLGAGFGLLMGALCGWTARGRVPTGRSPWVVPLALGVLAGLLPVVLMGRGAALPGFGSRFLVPVLPAATILTVWGCLRLLRPAKLLVGVVGWGLICGNASVTFAQAAVRDHDFATALSVVLKPYVAGPLHTVAVISRQGMDYELTARVTAGWSIDEAKRFWLYDLSAGEAAYGPRRACRDTEQLHKEVRELKRDGPVSRLLWIEVRGEKPVAVEPYCLTADSR